MATYNKFDSFVGDLCNKVHNLGSDTLKLLLTNTAPVRTNTVKANLTEIAAGNGYTAGGATVTGVTDTDATGTVTLASADATITASGGTIGPFRYVGLYNSTTAGGSLISWWDYGSSITLNDGETFTWKVSGNTNSAIFTLS